MTRFLSLSLVRRVLPLLALGLLALAGSAHATGQGPLLWPEACSRLPTPESRGECEGRQRRVLESWEQEDQARHQAARRIQLKPKRDRGEDLCFTRSSTGERVCAN
jgi:hypothetical protein